MDAETQDQNTQEPAEQDTLPVQLTSKEITTEKIASLEQYKNLVLSDLTDKAAAKSIDEKRREVKRARCLAESICDAEREEAMRTNQRWLNLKGDIAKRLKAVEIHLDTQFELHKNEMERLERVRQEAIRAARQKRLDGAKEAEADVTLEMVETMPDDEWSAMLDAAVIVRDARRRNKAISERLTELGDPCSIEEAAELTDDQAAYRIERATDDKRARDERARIEEEERKENERKERERLEEVARRVRELADIGVFSTFDTVAAMTDAEYAGELQQARDKRDQEAEAQRERQRQQAEQQARFDRGVERCRILARLGNYEHQPDDIADLDAEAFAALEQKATDAKAERDAETARLLKEEQDRQEAQRQAQERADEQERQEAASRERGRQEAIRPQREAVAKWAQAALDAMPSTPDIDDPDILRAMRGHVERARLALLGLREWMSAEPTN